MNKRVRKWFWVWQQDQEKAFLDSMADQGYQLVQVRLGEYLFEEQDDPKYVVQMDFPGLGRKMSEEEYLQLYQDAGWELVSKVGGWYYFRQPRQEGMDQSLFNDQQSRGNIYRRLLAFLALTGFPLYYQTLFLMPKMSVESPLFSFRILFIALTLIHLSGVMILVSLYMKNRRSIVE